MKSMQNMVGMTILLSTLGLAAAEVPAEPPTGEVALKGGKAVFGEAVEVLRHERDLNFISGFRMPDGTLYIHHTVGLHGVDEKGHSKFSTDAGDTWGVPIGAVPADTVWLSKEGLAKKAAFYGRESSDVLEVAVVTWNEDRSCHSSKKASVKLPFAGVFRTHGDATKLKDGRVLVCLYGKIDGEKKYSVVIIATDDDGESWHYLGCPFSPKISYGTKEGPCEAATAELPNGDLLCIARTGDIEHSRDNEPLIQSRSADGGKTWGRPQKIDRFGVSPRAKVLDNGTLVVCSGRPGVYLLVDFSGTGRNYQKVEVFKAPNRYQTSAYAALIPTGADSLLLIYDVSSFSTRSKQREVNHIFALPVALVKP